MINTPFETCQDGLFLPVTSEQIEHVKTECDGDGGDGAAKTEEGDIGEEDGVQRVGHPIPNHPVCEQQP